MRRADTDWGVEGEPSRWCRWLGHRWSNDHSRGAMFVHGEPCTVRGCTVTRRNIPEDFDPGPPVSLWGLPDPVATPTPVELEQELRTRLADEIHRIRFDGGIGATPDTFFFGVARAEAIIRGETL